MESPGNNMNKENLAKTIERVRKAFKDKDPIIIVVGNKKAQIEKISNYDIEGIVFGKQIEVMNVLFNALLRNPTLKDVLIPTVIEFIKSGNPNTFSL